MSFDEIKNEDEKSFVRAYLSANQTIADSTVTKVQLDAISNDVLGEFDDTTNYRFTAAADGQYIVFLNALFDLTTPYEARIVPTIKKNGSTIEESKQFSKYFSSVNYGSVVELDKDDYLEFFIEQTAGGNRDLQGGSGATFMIIKKLP